MGLSPFNAPGMRGNAAQTNSMLGPDAGDTPTTAADAKQCGALINAGLDPPGTGNSAICYLCGLPMPQKCPSVGGVPPTGTSQYWPYKDTLAATGGCTKTHTHYDYPECEHILPFLLGHAVMDLVRTSGIALPHTVHPLQRLEYEWAHNSCNKLKNQAPFIWLPFGIDDVLNELGESEISDQERESCPPNTTYCYKFRPRIHQIQTYLWTLWNSPTVKDAKNWQINVRDQYLISPTQFKTFGPTNPAEPVWPPFQFNGQTRDNWFMQQTQNVINRIQIICDALNTYYGTKDDIVRVDNLNKLLYDFERSQRDAWIWRACHRLTTSSVPMHTTGTASHEVPDVLEHQVSMAGGACHTAYAVLDEVKAYVAANPSSPLGWAKQDPEPKCNILADESSMNATTWPVQYNWQPGSHFGKSKIKKPSVSLINKSKKSKIKKPSVSLINKAKKYKIRLTRNYHGKRIYKTVSQLKKDIKQKNKKYHRKCPSKKAKEFKVGTIKIGKDKKKWIVKKYNKSKKWVRLTKSKK